MRMYSRMTKAVRSVLMKKNVFCLLGYRFASELHVKRMMYSMVSADNPIAALRFVRGRFLRVLMNTKYGASRVLTPVIPIRAGIWPTAMLIALPVMKALIAAKVMNSTIQPSRARPRNRTMAPLTIAKDDAVMSAGTSGSLSCTLRTTFPVTVDRTATGLTWR